MLDVGTKICGITRREDAEAAVRAGARYIGAVMYPRSPRKVTGEQARALSEGLEVGLVLVVADEEPTQVARWAEEAGASVVQLHGAESPAVVRLLEEAGPWRVWKAVRTRSTDRGTNQVTDQVEEALARYAGVADGILLDGWHPHLIGGTGVRVPLGALTRLREGLPAGTELVAAGGLTPETVGEVVRAVRPDVVDTSSGVEARPGIKDPRKIQAFLDAVRQACREGGDGPIR